MDPQHQPPVPVKKTLLIVNQFITQTTRFLNHFSTLAEEKLQKVFHDVNRIETTLVLLESRLHRLEGFDDMAAAPVTNSALQHGPGAGTAGGGAGSAAAAPPAAPAAAALPAVAAGTAAPAGPPPAVPEAPAPPPPPAPVVVKVKDDPVLAPYFRMLKIGAVAAQVKMKMAAEGRADPALLDLDPEAPSPLQQPAAAAAAPAAAAPAPAPAPTPSLAAPPPLPALMPPPPTPAAVAAPVPAPVAAAAAAPPPPPPPPPPAAGGGFVALKDDPSYGRFFRMLKMGVPPQAVANKVAAEGLDPAVMAQDPEGPSPFV